MTAQTMARARNASPPAAIRCAERTSSGLRCTAKQHPVVGDRRDDHSRRHRGGQESDQVDDLLELVDGGESGRERQREQEREQDLYAGRATRSSCRRSAKLRSSRSAGALVLAICHPAIMPVDRGIQTCPFHD